jgi:hypothetical protein
MCRNCNIPKTGAVKHPFARMTFNDLDAFLGFLTEHELKAVFRESCADDQETVHYTAYDSTTGIFVNCKAIVAPLQKFMGLSHGNGYRNGFSTPNGKAVLTYGNKRYWVNALKAINVNEKLMGSLTKIKVSELSKIAEDDDDEEIEEGGQISTDKKKTAPFPAKVACDTIDGSVTEVTVDVGKNYNSVTYQITVEDWANTVKVAVNNFEKQIIDKGIKVIPGVLRLIGDTSRDD